MTEIIKHRVNTIEGLKSTPKSFGVEVDIRSNGEELVIHHDPFESGVLFNEWIKHYNHGTLILNVKEEGLEPFLISKMASVGCETYFFLDQSFPFLRKYAHQASGRAAVRFSEFESLQTVISLRGQVSWVWVDCFTKLPLTQEGVNFLQESNFKTCLVSPELQGMNAEEEVPKFAACLKELKFLPDAVCTKIPNMWIECFGAN
jgi:hypothetical protein